MEITNFIEIEQAKCIECLQCLRGCDVNAIRYIDNKLFIHPERCVRCGKCYEQCPYGAVVVNGQSLCFNNAISKSEITIASISPTWVSEFRGVSMNQIVLALKQLGFTHVSQVVLGAEKVVRQTRKNLSSKNKPLVISSLCHVVNKLIEIYYPKYIEYLNPISTPETLHSRMLKEWYGKDAKVTYISSCLASYKNDILDGALTYIDLQELFERNSIDVHKFPYEGENHFQPFMATNYHGYQLVSSAIDYFPEVDVQSASGIPRVMSMLEDINVNDIEDQIYLELFACEGGCLTSIGSIDKNNMLAKKLRFDKHIRDGKSDNVSELPEVKFYKKRESKRVKRFAEEKDKEAVLRKMNITQSGSLLDCNACGYHTCSSFANAVVLNMAQVNSCVWHQKTSISQNLNSIIEHIPYGVFIVDNNMTFTNVNNVFCDTVGVDREVLLSGKVSIQKMISFSNEIKNVLHDSLQYKDYKILVNGREMRLDMHTLQQKDMVFGGLKNYFSSTSFNDEYVESVKKVIQENIISIQNIASMLGENVSRTETLLSSIVENKEH